eukprot:358257-Prorocentrum_minimum.AAC.2
MSLDSLMPSVMYSPSDRPEPVKSNANTVMFADSRGCMTGGPIRRRNRKKQQRLHDGRRPVKPAASERRSEDWCAGGWEDGMGWDHTTGQLGWSCRAAGMGPVGQLGGRDGTTGRGIPNLDGVRGAQGVASRRFRGSLEGV